MSPTADRYSAIIETDAAVAIAQWRQWIAAGAATSLFQTPQWLEAWFATLGAQPGRQPLFASIVRNTDGQLMLALPLVLHQIGALRHIEFADLGVTDYTAPLLSMECPNDAEETAAMIEALLRALPAADVLSAKKIPLTVSGRANPLLHMRAARVSPLFGNPVTVGDDFEAWRFRRKKKHRKELERHWRGFTRHPGAEFRLITDKHDVARVMHALETYQRNTILNKGWVYLLDEPGTRDFYHRLIEDGLENSNTVLSALMVGDEVIGALLGIRRGDEYALIRLANAPGEWLNCAPGLLVIERTMEALHAQGVRHFDLTIGDYRYKKNFLPDRLPLFEATFALSWKGKPHVASENLKHSVKAWIRSRPGLHRRLSAAKSALLKAK